MADTHQVIESIPGGVRIHLLIQPRASRNEMAGLQGDRLKVRLAAPPVEGEANEALILFLAKLLGVRRTSVSIAAGKTGRRKTVEVEGITLEKARRVFEL